MRSASFSQLVSFAIVCAATLAMTQPGHAGEFGKNRVRRGDSATPVAAGTGADNVVAGQGPNGGRGIHAGGWSGDGSGGAIHASGGAYSGPGGRAVRGSYTHWQSNGGVTHQGGHGVQGTNGGYDNGHNSYTHNPDGSGQASWQNNGQSANGGSVNSSGNFSRGSNGIVTGSSQTSASGAKGSYHGSTTSANGTTTHDGDYTNASGDSYQGQTSYTKGQGYTQSGSCSDAQGNTIPCR